MTPPLRRLVLTLGLVVVVAAGLPVGAAGAETDAAAPASDEDLSR